MGNIELLLFWTAMACYSVGTLAYLTYLAFRREWAGRGGLIALIAGWVIHLTAIILRWIEIGHVPLSNQFEFLSFFAWATVSIYLFTELQTKQKIIGSFAVPVVWGLMGVSWLSHSGANKADGIPAILQSPWFVIHVSVAVVSFAAFAMAFAVAIIYLLQEYHLKHKTNGSIFRRLPPLQILDNLSYRSVVLGFTFLTVTLISGMIWSQQISGKFWVWDPKITTAVATWIIFGAYLHARLTAGWQGRRSALIATIGFAAVLLTFGISYIVGPHLGTFSRMGG